MNQLQQEIYQSLLKYEGIADPAYEEGNPITASICKGHAEAVSGVCLRWIEQAIDDSVRHGWDMESGGSGLGIKEFTKRWLKENGL